MIKRAPLLVSVILVAGFAVYLSTRDGDKPATEDPVVKNTPSARPVRERIDWDVEMRKRPNREFADSLRSRLLAMPAPEAVAEIEAYLKSGKDTGTDMDFEIGDGGALKSWPTLRVLLLDLLLEIDPAAAARISRGILAAPTSADEWAIALRNVARGEVDTGNRDYLRMKTEELINQSAWQEQPSIGYLNAFDVLVHTEATESTALLSGLIQRKDRRDLAHAGFLTLDRLVQRKPVEMLKKLGSDRVLQESRPEMVAQEFARADLRDPAQRELAKAWLLDPMRTPTELRNFAEVYPNNNQMISKNLLTSEGKVAGTDLREHDLEVLSLVRGWRQDPEFGTLAQYLETMDRRLSEFTRGAESPPR